MTSAATNPIMNKLKIGTDIKHVSQDDLLNNLDAFEKELGDSRIYVKAPDGSTGSILISGLREALNTGYQLIDDTEAYNNRPDIIAKREAEREERRKQAKANPINFGDIMESVNSLEESGAMRELNRLHYQGGMQQSITDQTKPMIENAVAPAQQALDVNIPKLPWQTNLEYAETVAAAQKKSNEIFREQMMQGAIHVPESLEEIYQNIDAIDSEIQQLTGDKPIDYMAHNVGFGTPQEQFLLRLGRNKSKDLTPEQRQRVNELQQQKKALGVQADLLRKFQKYEEYDKKSDRWALGRFFGGMYAGGDLQALATFGLSQINRDIEFLGILEKARDGKELTNEEKKAIQLYQNLQQIQGKERGAFFSAGTGMQATFEFMRDMAMFGFGGIAKGAANQGIKQIAKQSLKNYGKKTLDILLKAPVTPSFYKNLTANQIDNYEIKDGENGTWDINQKESSLKNIYRSYVETTTEFASEALGGVFENIGLVSRMALSKGKGKGILSKAVKSFDRMHNKALHNKWAIFLLGGMEKMGLNNMPSEFLEEIAVIPMQSLLLWENQFGQLADPRFYQEVAISTAALGGMNSTVNIAFGGPSAIIESRKINKNLSNVYTELEEMRDSNDDIEVKAAIDHLFSDVKSRNFYDEDYEFTADAILRDLDMIRRHAGNNPELIKKAEDYVQLSLFKEGQTEAMRAIVEHEIGNFEYGTSGNVMLGATRDGQQVFILDETGSSVTVRAQEKDAEPVVMARNDIINMQPLTMDSFVTDYLISKRPGEINIETIDDIQQMDQQTEQAEEHSASPANTGDRAIYDGVEVEIIDTFDNDAIIRDANGQTHTVPVDELRKSGPITDNYITYILPDGRRGITAGKDSYGNYNVQILDDNNQVVDVVYATPEDLMQYNKLEAQEAKAVEAAVETAANDTLPMDKDGNIDFDTLLVQSPERFLQEYSNVVGQERTIEHLQRVNATIGEKIQQVTGKLEKTTSLNESIKLQQELANLDRQRNSIQSILQPTENSTPVEETIPTEQEIISTQEEISPAVEETTTVNKEINPTVEQIEAEQPVEAIEESVEENTNKKPKTILEEAQDNVANAKLETEAGQINTEPTEGQKEAGNYKMGHVKINGFDITIENPKGSIRSGVDKNGSPWEVQMNNHYGYIRRTKGNDGDQIDVFVGDSPTSGKIFIVDQVDNNGKFDEHKVMMGFDSIEEAEQAYMSNYSPGWKGLGNITEVSVEDFKEWAKDGKKKLQPFAGRQENGEPTLLDVVRTLYTKGKDAASKLFSMKFFEVAKTPQFMQDLGLSGEKFTIKYGVISRHIGKDGSHDLTEKDWEQLPEALQNPFAISKLGDKDNSYRIYTTLKTDNGEYVVVGADVKNAGREIEVNAISTVFGRRNNASLPKNEEVIYTSKEITPEQSSLLKRPNFAQYPTEQGLPTGTGKGTQSVSKKQTSEQQESSEASAQTVTKRNRIVDDERYAHLRARLREKISQLNVGIDPEMLSIGIEMAIYHIENGAYKFVDYTRKMVADVGDAIRPYLKAFYNGARDFPGMEEYSTQMDNYADVSATNVNDIAVDEPVEATDTNVANQEETRDLQNLQSSDAVEQKSNLQKNQVRGTVTKDVNTKTGADIWVVKLDDRVGREEFLRLKSEAKKNGGYYSNFKKGFIFTSKSDANNFNNIDNEEITDTQAEQRTADTIAINSEAETVISKIGSQAEAIRTTEDAVSAIDECNRTLARVNGQLALLGYYQADYDDSKFNEVYGYAKTAEKKALKDAETLAKDLAKDLGIDIGRKKVAKANIAPAGGDIAFRLPLNDGKQLYVDISLMPNSGYFYDKKAGEDDLFIRGVMDFSGRDAIMYRVEDPNTTGPNRYGINNFADADVTYQDLLSGIKNVAGKYLASMPEQSEHVNATVDELVNPLRESSNHGFKVGDKVLYNGKIATITDFDMGRPVLDTGLAPVMYELANWDDISRYEEPQTQTENEKGTVQELDGSTTTSGRERQPRVEDETLGSSQQPQILRDEPSGMDKDSSTTVGDDSMGSRGVSERIIAQQDVKNSHNWRYPSTGTDIPTSPTARLKANMEAIKVLRELQENNTQATAEQMKILSRYSGWGGMGTYFNSNQARIPGSDAAQLKELLSDQEYSDAVMSLNSAYYTPVEVINTLWDVAKQLGFKGGNILEGSAGTGNILGFMPEDISGNSNIEAVEIDSISGSILSYLYPDAQVHIQGFEKTAIANNSVDLAITNVPFVTGLRVNDPIDKDLSRKFKNIHDFCIAKNVRKLRDGGIGIFITSNGTLDKSKQLRDWIISREGNADVIGAFRLNNRTFEGASVTSDIIVVRKRAEGKQSASAIDVLNTSTTKVVPVKVDEKFNKKTGQYEDITREVALDYNTYFQQHPEFMGGEMAIAAEKGDTFRPASIGLYPAKDIDQNERLRQWISTFTPVEQTVPTNAVVKPAYEQSAEKEGSLVLDKQGRLCISRRGEAVPLDINNNKIKGKYTKAEALNDYNKIKQALSDVLEYQVQNSSDDGLKPLLKKLNSAYDNFVKKYGSLNRNVTISFLRNDVDFTPIAAIENYSETETIDGKKKVETTKTDVFKERVIGYEPAPTPTSVKDGIILSVQKNGHIDTALIAQWLGMDPAQVLEEVISFRMGFINPANGLLEVRYEYLTGNVREKLAYAKANNSDNAYDTNIEELEKVIPMDIPAHFIEFSLGSTWIDPKLYSDFVKEKYDVNVEYRNISGIWAADRDVVFANNEKNRSAGVYSESVGKRVMGHELFAAAMNNTPITISKQIKHYNGTTETITDKQASQMCTVRMQEIKEEFKDWARSRMQADADLAQEMTRIYNDKFNAIVPKTIDDVFTPERFEGANKVIDLYPHQKKSVIRATTEPLMLAHEVGTGKTFTLITTAMEMRRLGTAKKPMIVVQNATVGQFVSQAKFLYPNAKVLTVGEKDRTAEGRKEFYAKIKYNDWDIIVVPQSVFEMIPDNETRMRDFVQEKIDEKLYAIEAAREAGMDSRFINQLENELQQLEEDFATGTMNRSGKKNEKKEAVAAQNAQVRAEEQLQRATDDVEDFDAMDIDALLVDEAHEYKHLGFSTSMKRGIKGVDPSYSKKAASVYLKTRAVLEKSGGKNVVFATGTPISNTAAEIWTFMKYLMSKDMMVANDIYYFDDFVRNFGNITQNLEFATNGKFKENTRFASYVNLPELVRLWSSVSDTVLTKEVKYVNDKVPQIETGKAIDIFLPQSPGLVDIMRGVRMVLEEYDKMSGKEKKANSHIPLTMYGIAKRAAIDPRLVDSNAIDEPLSKTNRAVEETLRTLEETKDYKGTVAIFCDSYRRLEQDVTGKKKETFNLFQEIKRKLVASGVPANQIVIMESGMSVAKKEKVFADVNAGAVRVILGSTQTLGTGVNIQQRLHTLIHMDAPDRPMDYTQRNGRILRQGNLHKEWNKTVRVLRFGVEDSLDVTSYQRLKTKSAFIDSVMDSKPLLTNNQENRTLEEEEEGLFDNPVAILSGSQYALLKSQAERDLRKWQSKFKQWEADQVYVNAQLKRNAGQLEKNTSNESLYKQNIAFVENRFPEGKASAVTIDGIKCSTEEERIQAYKDINKKMNDRIEKLRNNPYGQREQISYSLDFDGMPVEVTLDLRRDSRYNEKIKGIQVSVHRDMKYSIPDLNIADVPVSGAYIKGAVDDILENVITGKDAAERIDVINKGTKRLQEENKLLSARDGKPFEHTQELNDARAKVEEYTTLMKKELEEKEAKYAEMGTGATVDVENVIQDDDSAVQAQIDQTPGAADLSYSEQIAYDAVREALSNANIPVVMATDEMVEEVLHTQHVNSMAAERQSIIDTAKLNGTYLKAPNGQNTNLSPEQWVTVRTQAFKRWFGDWEKAVRVQKLKESRSISITGKEVVPSDDIAQYRKNAEIYAKGLRGEYINKDTGNTIELTSSRKNGGIREILHHDYKNIEHLQSVAAIPQIIENSIFITSLSNEDSKIDADFIDYYVCGLKIADVDYTVKSVIVQLKDGTRYYDHKLTSIEKSNLVDLINNKPDNASNPISSESSELPGLLSNNKDRRLFAILQDNSSKVVDENGEPMVVYHGTNAEFSKFDINKFGQTDLGSYGKGFYFTARPERAKRYGENIIPVFINARNLINGMKDEALAFVFGSPTVADAKARLFDPNDNAMTQKEKETASGLITKELVEEAKKYDGVDGSTSRVKFDELVVINPNQIKSATDNTGEFSAESDDIRFSIDSDGISEDNLLQHQQELSKVDKIINTWRSQGKSIPEVFWKERGKIIKNFLDEIGTEPVTMVTKATFENVMSKDGVSTKSIEDIKYTLINEQIPGIYLNGKIYIFSDAIIDMSDAHEAYIHERQHMFTHQDFKNNVNEILSRVESEQKLEDIVVTLSGNENYRGYNRANLADEFISFAMALSYTNANFADELRKAGANEQLIEYIDEYSRSQWQKQDLSKSRRRQRPHPHVRMDEERDTSKNVRNSGERSAEVVQQGFGSAQGSQRRTGGREFFKSGAGTVRGWTKDGVIYLTKDGLNPETPIHEYTHIWADAVRKYNPALWSNVKSLMKQLPQWKQVVSDPNYQDIAGNEDAVASEVLARYSGKRGAKRLVQDAKQFGETTGRKGYAAQLIQRVKKVLEDFWKWVNVNLFNISEFSSAEEAADRVLYDLVSGTDLSSPTTITDNILKQNGVKGLLGNEAYNAMMDDIFAGIDIITQANIIKQGDRTAQTREYIAKVCSNVSAHPQEALQIVNSVRDAFQNKGMSLNVTDTELLYKMWQDNNNEPRQTLKENIIHFDKSKKVKSSIEHDFGPTTNDIKLSFAEAFKEKIVDRMHSVSVLLKTITTRGGVITPDTDPYMSENLASARSMYEIDKFKQELYEPLLQKVVEIQKLFVSTGLVKSKKLAYKAVNDYLYALHAPERNKHICVEEVVNKMLKKLSKEELKFFKSSDHRGVLTALVSRMYNERKNPSTPATSGTFAKNIVKDSVKDKTENELLQEFRNKFSDLNETARKDIDKIFKSKRGTNRSGMSDEEAKGILERYNKPETANSLKELSAMVQKCNDFTLDTWLKYSMIDQQTYDSYKNMYQHYIPLRSWAEREDVDYDSLGKSAFNHASEIVNLNRKAYGRSSRADAPIAYIASLAQSAVVVGNKNMVHLNAFRLIQKNKELLDDIAILPQIYYVEVEGSDEVIAYDERPPQELFDKGMVTTQTNKSYRWHKTNAEYEAHTVPVIIKGQRHMMVFKGNIGVKIASALNNTNVNHIAAADAIRPLTRWLSAVRTSYSPEFVFVNFVRDFLFGELAYAIERGNSLKLAKNIGLAFKAINRSIAGRKETTDLDVMYDEFCREGGQTGFIHMRKIEQIKKENEVMYRRLSGKKNISDVLWRNAAVNYGKKSMEYLSAMSENTMRFAVYMTEREKGTSAKEAAYKAHEITVNFNRKGTWSENFNAFYSFFNASVQGAYRLWQLGKKHPKRTVAAIGSLALAKVLSATIAAMVGGDDYDELSDYVKFSNFIIPVGIDDDGRTVFVTIPTPQGMRVFTNIADITVDVLRGNKSISDAMGTWTLNAIGDFMPLSVDAIDLTARKSGQSIVAPFVPTAVQPFFDVWSNKDFKGDPIYKEDYTKGTEDYTPEYKKVYSNANPVFVKVSKVLNEFAGGSDELSSAIKINKKTGEVSRRSIGYLLDINPAAAEHIINGYLGGVSTFLSNIAKTANAAVNKDVDMELYTLPIAGRFVRQAFYKEGYDTWYKVADRVKDIEAAQQAMKREKNWDSYALLKQNRLNAELTVTFNVYNDRVKQLQQLIKSSNISPQEQPKYSKMLDELIAEASGVFDDIIKKYEED